MMLLVSYSFLCIPHQHVSLSLSDAYTCNPCLSPVVFVLTQTVREREREPGSVRVKMREGIESVKEKKKEGARD